MTPQQKGIRVSRLSLSLLERLSTLAIMVGYKVVRPIYADWWWRGYSIVLEPPAGDAEP